MADTKEIVVTTGIDVGKNMTEFIEKLAHQIGTTADKVFPWYVKQSVLEGYIFLAVMLSVLTVGLALFLVNIRILYSDKSSVDKRDVYSVIGAVLTLIAFGGLFVGGMNAITSIVNPNYHAMRALIHDISKLR